MMESKLSAARTDPMRTAWRKSRMGLAVIVLFSVFINVLRLAVPLYILQILDRVIGSRSMETLVMLTTVTMVAVVFGILMEVIRRQMLIAWGNWIERFFGPILFTAGLKKSGTEKNRVSGFLRDIRTLRSFVAGEALTSWIDVVWAPFFVAIVFLISPLLGYILLSGMIATLILGILNERMTRNARELSYLAVKDDQDWISTAERHHETVGSLDTVTNFAKRWWSSALVRLDEGMRTQLINVYFAATMRMVGRFLRVILLATGVWLVVGQELTLGAVIAVSVLGRTAYSLVQKAMGKWREMAVSRRAYGRIEKFLKKDNDASVSIPTSQEPVPLVLDKVSYRYPSQATSIFRDIDLTAKPGEALFILGPSACGKTTLSRLISGLISPRSGGIRLGDVNAFQLQQNSMVRVIGAMPQDTTLFRGTVRENIASMSLGDIDEVVRVAKLAGIHGTIIALPEGYDTVIVEYEPLLSSGQRKAITLARAFYGRPSLVVLDEPIPHLDKPTRSALFKAIEQLKAEGTIVVVTTQSRTPSKYADKVISFDGNRYRILRTAEEISALRIDTRRRRQRRNHVKRTERAAVNE